jgi:hypothetical protein
LGFLKLEALEERALLSTTWIPGTTNLADVQNGPMANAGQDLIAVYQASLGSSGTSNLASQFSTIQFQGSSVGINTNWNGTGSFGDYITALKNLGMQVTASSVTYGIVEGYLPVSQLPTVAAEPQTLALAAVYKPIVHFQGVANNEAVHALSTDVAAQSLGLNGAGQTIGVLSDSVSQAGRCSRTSTTPSPAPTWRSPPPTAATWPLCRTSWRSSRRHTPA